MSRKVALLGTGLIGSVAARRLVVAGHEVTVWDREPAKAEGLPARVAATPADALRGADTVTLFLLDEQAVADVLDDAALGALEPGALVIDLATASVAGTTRFVERVRAAGGRAAVAPFFGSVPEAEQGALYALAGCNSADLDDVRELLAPLCSGVYAGGAPTETAALKLALNVLVFPMVELIGESLALARAQGVDPEHVLAVLAEGTGVRSPIYSGRGRLILDRDFAPRATVELATKDLALIAGAAAAAGLELPLVERTRALFDDAAAAGLARADMAAVTTLIESSRG
jgi:3-hydroxyisobutyrate dehydrogenase